MKGQMRFTRVEAERIRAILGKLRQSSHDDQKRYWGELCEIGFYISDFRVGADAFTREGFDRFIEIGEIEVC